MPATFSGKLAFRIKGSGRQWEDTLPVIGGVGVNLFTEHARDALLAEGVRGLTFHEAEITEVVKNKSLAKKNPPQYFWAKAAGLIVYDYLTARAGKGTIPLEIKATGETDLFHLMPDRAGDPRPWGYVCTFKVLEAVRKHRVGNLHVFPIDFSQLWPGLPTGDVFRIDLFGPQWPPQWYPAGFTPHPSNQIPDGEPIAYCPPAPAIAVEHSPEMQRTARVFDWAAPQPIDAREVDCPWHYHKLRMNPADVDRLERELHLKVPGFLRQWFLENPLRDDDSTRALICHADLLIQENVKLRRKGVCGRTWPESLLWIGDDWGGGEYFVDATLAEPAVFYFDIESGQDEIVLSEESESHTPEEFIRYIKSLSE